MNNKLQRPSGHSSAMMMPYRPSRQRELWGQYWIFAHNGNLENFTMEGTDSFVPVGRTDSDRAFCRIIGSLRSLFPNGRPANEDILRALGEITPEIAAHGEFNCLLSNGEALFALCSSHLHYLVRKALVGQAHLIDQDLSV